MPPLCRAVNGLVKFAAPYKRWAMLKSNLDVFKRFDALVVPDKTSLLLKQRLGLTDLKLIHTRHGAGDRAIGFNAASGDFDFVLLSGRKYLDRLLARGLLKPGQYAIVGYPKFDTVQRRPADRRRLFANDRPTVLYNPHFDPRLSSWYGMSRDILEFFYRRDDYNLIVAPHVMLFERRIHISLEDHGARFRRGIPGRYRECPHIRIDTGSAASCDMTYTLAADIYLGDVSSQVYEFLIEPRPCIFLKPRAAQSNGSSHDLHRRLGPVIDDVSSLDDCLARARESHRLFRPSQEKLFRYTFDLQAERSSVRAADAIATYLESTFPGLRRAATGSTAGTATRAVAGG